ncbi:hypothetical protein BIW11_07936 [Tropilaelaps mercedesae]|uniref:Uncharacterized protein n=1 Tax=Tropilaelaps mercedesae TaxID=418985 RepID=A0A1V9XRR6_9ACAR|nr:hypothetical protein BIW11_07936 [Tropilaelaps mercedesae]
MAEGRFGSKRPIPSKEPYEAWICSVYECKNNGRTIEMVLSLEYSYGPTHRKTLNAYLPILRRPTTICPRSSLVKPYLHTYLYYTISTTSANRIHNI